MGEFPLLFVFSLLFSILPISPARDGIALNDTLQDDETIISSGGIFEMGYFSPNNSLNRYVGIWYKKIPVKTVVWVANREVPLSANASSVVLRIINLSQLALLSDNNDVIWFANMSLSRSVQNPVLQLLDSGNLVVRDGGDVNPENFFWQSFDHPTDTLLPGMKVGFVTGHEVYLTAWKSDDNPAPAEYSVHIDNTGYPQGFVMNGTAVTYRSGPWNGVRWSGVPMMDKNPIYTYALVINKHEVYTSYSLNNNSIISILVLTNTGFIERLVWVGGMKNWITFGKFPTDSCDMYRACGANGICNIYNFPICGCLDKFLPRNQEAWNIADYSGGCVRRRGLHCNNGTDIFVKYPGIKLPDTKYSWYDETMTLQECEQVCLKNCSCTAYSRLDIRNGGSGCLLWFGDLIDIRKLSDRGQDIYIRLASSELDKNTTHGFLNGSKRKRGKKLELLAASVSSVIGLILVGLSLMFCLWRKKTEVLHDHEFELPIFDFPTIARATNNFSVDNKLGQGGFGPVYKISPARDTISLDDPLPENETIISSGGTFEMGIFSPSFTFSYVGIWYKNIPARPVVWVANRKVPLSKNATSLVLKIVNSSHLALLSNANDVILSVNTSLSFSSPVMQLLDSGNLVVRDAGDENPENFLWQSFDYPTDTYLPGMKMGINFQTGHEVYLSAWKSAEDPSPSDYTSNLLVTGYPQGIIRQGKALICRSGPWNGVRWSGIPSPDINPIYNYVLVINKTEIYTNYSLVKKSVISVLYMNYTGVVHRLMWVEGMRDWITIGKLPTDDCDRYGNCGGNGLCNIGNFPVCGCLDHFLPRNQADWGMAKFAGGCVRKKSLECHTGKDPGGFLKYSGIKVPDTQNSWYNETMTIQECQQECLKNCNCTAFSSLDVRNGGSGCLMWFGDLVDIRQMSERGQDIFIRLASSELGSRREHRKILEIVAVSLSAVAGLIVVGLSLTLYVRRKKKTKFLRDEDFELPVFHLRTIARATNNFSADNKLGEGGFGPVYKIRGPKVFTFHKDSRKVLSMALVSVFLEMNSEFRRRKVVQCKIKKRKGYVKGCYMNNGTKHQDPGANYHARDRRHPKNLRRQEGPTSE
nr:uncharacterized protein LOC109149192 [Ipomoea trifida]